MSNISPEATSTIEAQQTINVFGENDWDVIGQIEAGQEFQVDPDDTCSLFGENDGLKVSCGQLVGWASRSEIYPDGEQVQTPEAGPPSLVEP
ncbi:hypothetical protein JW766_02590 [Candidatus Dojkabacteria bacterium]|nr:hypothetical protein [Candidatus Dojkabacteria bacterium]